MQALYHLGYSPSEGISSQTSFLKGKTVSYFNFLYQWTLRRVQAPQLQTPNVDIYSRGCNCYCNCDCGCNCDCILFFLLYYRECYANFRNRECRPESVVLTFSLPRLLHRPRRILRRVLGPEMKFKWICIGIRLNRLCKHFVSFHLRAFRFLGSLTVNSAMWMCESFPVLPLPLPSSSSTPICGHVSTAAPQPSTLCPPSRSFCAIWFASSSSSALLVFRFSFAKRKNYIEKPQELISALI